MNITVLGGGAWGTAMSQLVGGHLSTATNVTLWCFEKSVVDSIEKKRINETYLPDIELNKKISATSDIKEAIDDAEVIFCAVPIPFMRGVLERVKQYLKPEQKFVLLSKGIELETGMFSSEILCDVLGKVPHAILSGPNLAKEVAQKKLSATVIASSDNSLAQEIKKICECEFFHVQTSADVIGVQVGGALKNVMTIFLGMACGCGVGENFFAFLSSRALSEMVTFAKICGGKPETIYGLAGFGDILLGLCEDKTRNYRLGEKLGRGEALGTDKILPEGVNTIKAIHKFLQKKNITLPICDGIYKVIYDNKSIPSFLHSLFNDLNDF
jgi:glycerol-3-phosphate dehydrogenase (NAD(P)+)